MFVVDEPPQVFRNVSATVCFGCRYVTPDLHVICHSLKEYNAYRNFLEFEFMKLRKQQEDEVKERERKVYPSDAGMASVINHVTLYMYSTRVTFESRAAQVLWTKTEKQEEGLSTNSKKRS